MTVTSLVRAGVAAFLAVVVATRAPAQVSTERGASVLMFPKIIADASADSVVQLANLSNSQVHAFCTYVDGTTWQALDFTLTIGPQRPLYWVASRGRAATETDPNDIPAAPADFRGELVCVQVDGAGSPFSGNQLVGHVTVASLDQGDIAAYAAIGLTGLGFNDGDDVLCLGGDASDACLIGAEYDACPAEWTVAHPTEGAPDSQLGGTAQLGTRFTVVPCGQNVRDGEPGSVVVDLSLTTEFEEHFSAAQTVGCWADLSLAQVAGGLFTSGALSSDVAQMRLRPSAESGGFALVAEIERRGSAAGPVVSRSALTPHRNGAAALGDLLIVPMGRP